MARQISSNCGYKRHCGLVKAALTTQLLALAVPVIAEVDGAQNRGAERATPTSLAIEEILVTARKREESLQDVPLSVTAVSGSDLVNAGYMDLTSVGRVTPNVFFESIDQSRSYVYIRGIGTRETSAGSDPSVGVFVDGVYQPRFSTLNMDLSSVERIEVLRGPQGTLYGRNTIGGAISVITADPSDEWEGRGSLEIGNGDTPGDDLRNIALSASGPLSDELSARFSVTRRDRDGFTKIVGRSDRGNSEDLWGFNAKLKWTATDNLHFTLALSALDVDEGASILVPNGYGDPDTVVPGISPLASQPVFPDDPYRDVEIDGPIVMEKEVYGAALTSVWSKGSVEVTSITAFQASHVHDRSDNDGTGLDIVTTRNIEDSDQFSQELRVDFSGEQWDLLMGLFYSKEDADRLDEIQLGADSLLALVNGFVPVNIFADNPVETTSYAAFGQFEWRPVERLKLTAGIRWSRDEKEADYDVGNDGPAIFASILGTFQSDVKESWNSVDPMVSLSYDVSDELMVYATVATGYKAGAIQHLPFQEAVSKEIVDPEEVINYELGFKSLLLNRRLQANVSAFWMDYTDLQQYQLVDLGDLSATVQTNAADSTIKGIEVEGIWLLSEVLSVDFMYSYLDAEFDDYIFDTAAGGGITTDYSGNTLPRSPENTYSLAFNYSQDLMGGRLFGRLAYSWRDSVFFEPDNDQTSIDAEEDAFGLLDASIGFAWDRWSVSLWGTNLNNEEYRTHILANESQVQLMTLGAPRTFGARVNFEF